MSYSCDGVQSWQAPRGTCSARLRRAGVADSCCPSILLSSPHHHPAFPVPLASLLLAGAGPAEQPGGKEETGRDGSLACPVAYRQGCPHTAPVCCRGGRRSLPQALYPSQGWPGGFCGDRGDGRTWGTAGEAAGREGKGGEGGKQPGREEKAAWHRAHRIWVQQGLAPF